MRSSAIVGLFTVRNLRNNNFMPDQFLEFHLDLYPFLRHIYRKRHISRKGVDSHQLYLRKKNSRLRRRDLLAKDEEAQKFFEWIWSIQRKLQWNNVKFAREVGVTLQTLKLWRNSHGHYPSQKSLKKLLELDLYASKVETRKIVLGITTTKLIVSRNYV